MNERTQKKIDDWEKFCNEMEAHIEDKGLIYDEALVSFADIASNLFWADSLIKYSMEVKENILARSVPSKATLMSIAHIAQILVTRYYHAPITLTDKGERVNEL